MLVDYVIVYLVIWPDSLKSSDLCVNLTLPQYLTNMGKLICWIYFHESEILLKKGSFIQWI